MENTKLDFYETNVNFKERIVLRATNINYKYIYTLFEVDNIF